MRLWYRLRGLIYINYPRVNLCHVIATHVIILVSHVKKLTSQRLPNLPMIAQQ
jgi:hypothetical protein